jgi:hypothetical protein
VSRRPKTPAELLAEVRAHGGEFLIAQNRIEIHRARAIPPALVRQLQAQQQGVRALLVDELLEARGVWRH